MACLHKNRMDTPPLFTGSEKLVAILGNASAWIFATLSQEFMWVAAGVASISTAAYMITKMVLLIKGYRSDANDD
jgi:hypothetical protein